MGTGNSHQDWRDQFEIVPSNHPNPQRLLLKRKNTNDLFQMTSLYFTNEESINSLLNSLKEREQFKSPFLAPLEKVYHNNQNNICSSQLKCQIISPKYQSPLSDHFFYRKSIKSPFSPEQIMYIIHNTCLGLKDIKSMNGSHGKINLKTIFITNQVVIEDPIIARANIQETNNFRSNKVDGYPSPAALFSQIDSGMRVDTLLEDLFSVGIVALQLLHPEMNIKTIYQNKNKKHQNPRVDFELVSRLVQNIHHRPLQQWVAILVNPNSQERLAIFPFLSGINIPKNRLQMLTDRPKNMSFQQEIASSVQGVESSQRSSTNTTYYPSPQLSLQQSGQVESQNNLYPQRSVQQHLRQNELRGQPQTLGVPDLLQSSHQAISQSNISTLTFNPQTYSRLSYQENSFFPQPIPTNYQSKQHYTIHPLTMNSHNPAQSSINFSKPTTTFQSQNYQINPTIQPIAVYRGSVPSERPSSHQYLDNYYQQIPRYRLSPDSSPVPVQFDSANNKKIVQITKIQTSKQENLPQLKIKSKEQSHKVSLIQELAQLQKLTKENQQLQQKVNVGATNLFKDAIIPTSQQQPHLEREQASFLIEKYEDGTKYEGFVKNQLRNGYGKFYYQDGSIYDGEWKNNLMDGFGTLFYPEGKIAYQGRWLKDEFHGKGVIYNDNPEIIDGKFDYTNFKKLSSNQWQRYEGQCLNSKRHGKGQLILSNGQFFQGEFKLDMPHGQGTFTPVEGNSIKGVWTDGLLNKIVN